MKFKFITHVGAGIIIMHNTVRVTYTQHGMKLFGKNILLLLNTDYIRVYFKSFSTLNKTFASELLTMHTFQFLEYYVNIFFYITTIIGVLHQRALLDTFILNSSFLIQLLVFVQKLLKTINDNKFQ